MKFPFDEYCERTDVSEVGAKGLDRVEELQRAQIYSIPFENFDIQLGRGIKLSMDHLVDKLVRSQRGGYCFELNGLFLAALRATGFEARALLARVHVLGEPTGRGHQLSLVTVAGRDWIADVGFGGACPRLPMPLEHDIETLHDGQLFRLVPHALGHMLQHQQEGHWTNLYSFDLTPVVPNDIAYGNHFTSSHPSSFFTTSRVAVRWFPDGQSRLFNFRCTTVKGGEEQIDELPDDERYLSELRSRFGIELDADYVELAAIQGDASAPTAI